MQQNPQAWFGESGQTEGLIMVEKILVLLRKNPTWNLERVLDKMDLPDETLKSIMIDMYLYNTSPDREVEAEEDW